MFDFLFRKQPETSLKKGNKKPSAFRSFIGAKNTGMNRFNSTFARINQELKQDYIALCLRSRELYKNNETVHSYIDLMIRNILGNQGFILNVTAYAEDGTSDIQANQTIEDFWYEYTRSSRKYVSADEQQNGIDFDRQIIFNFLIDGQVFIRKIKDKTSKFGIRYQIIDSLDVDTLFNVSCMQDGTKITMGIKTDEHNKPLSYFIRKNKSSDYYLQGERVEVPAEQIIHIYKHLFPNQIRGFTPLSAVLLSLNGLDEYKRAEINASLLNASFMGIWEKTSPDANSYDEYAESEVDNQGNVAIELESNVFRYAPDGFKLNQISSNHPNSSVKDFCKVILKGIAGALGISYNKISSDVSETSYSSLRQANIQDAVTVKECQQFIIDNWKDVQYQDFLKFLLISDLTNLPYSRIEKYLSHDFQGRNFEYLDPAKEMQAIQLRLQLGLSNPIMEIHNAGRDPYDILNGWQKWNEMLKTRNLKLSDTINLIDNLDENTIKNDENQEE